MSLSLHSRLILSTRNEAAKKQVFTVVKCVIGRPHKSATKLLLMISKAQYIIFIQFSQLVYHSMLHVGIFIVHIM